jgi:hypothetical protein
MNDLEKPCSRPSGLCIVVGGSTATKREANAMKQTV